MLLFPFFVGAEHGTRTPGRAGAAWITSDAKEIVAHAGLSPAWPPTVPWISIAFPSAELANVHNTSRAAPIENMVIGMLSPVRAITFLETLLFRPGVIPDVDMAGIIRAVTVGPEVPQGPQGWRGPRTGDLAPDFGHVHNET
ncbi:hypothetical protein AB0D04_41060 [Streptomyces sp. NPDC048483]|uniref:hypothetical protein n=1 Tax=Streptomyces sp. NPDC048483 TaxID=3154927 RepID=UPI0034333BED